MSGENRRPVIIAIVCASLAALVLVVGIGFGGRGSAAGFDWGGFLGRFAPQSTLDTCDLTVVDGACDLRESVIVVSGSCRLAVAGFGGGLDLGAAVKRGDLVAVGGPVEVQVRVEGTQMSQDLAQDDRSPLTFGTDGGALRLTCLGIATATCSTELQ